MKRGDVLPFSRLKLGISILLLSLLTISVARGQTIVGLDANATTASDKPSNEPSVTIEPATAKPGQSVQMIVTIPLKSGLHIYGPGVKKPFFATNVKVINAGPITWDHQPIYPATKTLNAMGQKLSLIEPDPKTNSVIILWHGKVTETAANGKQQVKVSLTYQACSEFSCLPPKINKEYITTIVVEGSNTNPVVEKHQDPVSTVSGYGSSFTFFNYTIDLKSMGIWLPLVVAFLAGLILNVMPCVLPVIPIKILQLTRQAQQEHHSPIRLALVFGLGIVSFFLAIGVAAVILKSGFSWGQSFQSPTVLIGISLVLLVLALGMFDIYQIGVPSFIAGHQVVRKGYLGALSMGFLAGILSTPCSFGILGAAITWAQSQKEYLTLLTFLTIGIGMASPYIALSGFPNLINKLPHTGRWSELFKEAMGFILLGVAAFLITALPKDRILSVLLYFILFSCLVWFWGRVLEYQPGFWAKIGRGMVVIAVIVGGWTMLKAPQGEMKWESFNAQTLADAQKAKQTVLVDFTADWCLNCRTVEYRIFKNAKVDTFLKEKQVRILKADLTEENPYAHDMLKTWTGQGGIPFTVILKHDGSKTLLPGIYSPEDLFRAIRN